MLRKSYRFFPPLLCYHNDKLSLKITNHLIYNNKLLFRKPNLFNLHSSRLFYSSSNNIDINNNNKLDINELKSSIQILNNNHSGSSISNQLDINNKLNDLHKNILLLNEFNKLSIEERFYFAKFLLSWNLPRFYNENQPNNNRFNNPNENEMNRVWNLLDINEISNNVINEKFINTKLSLALEYPRMVEKVRSIVLDTVDLVETNRLDPDTSFIRLLLSFQLCAHLSLWNEMRSLGDMISNNYSSAMAVMHEEAQQDINKLDYHSIYLMLDNQLSHLETLATTTQPPITATIKDILNNSSTFDKHSFGIKTFVFQNNKLQCLNLPKEIEEKAMSAFNISNNDNSNNNNEQQSKITNPNNSEMIIIGNTMRWSLQFESFPTIVHSGIIDKDKVYLFGYLVTKQNENLELEIASEFICNCDRESNENYVVFNGIHKRTVRNTENDQTYIYTMDVKIIFEKEF